MNRSSRIKRILNIASMALIILIGGALGTVFTSGEGIDANSAEAQTEKPSETQSTETKPEPDHGDGAKAEVTSEAKLAQLRLPGLESGQYEPRRPEQTVFYQAVARNYRTFEAIADAEGKRLPKHVSEEFEAFLRCGILAHGFLRVACLDCKHEKLVAFSCKKRGFCSSCGGRRMAESAAHLVDEVFPNRLRKNPFFSA